MQYNPEELKEILNIYKVESEEIIQGLNDGFMDLEKNPNDKTPLKKLFQLAHSLKGASRMLNFNSIQDLSHKLEDVLSFWSNENILINPDSFHIIYQVCDFLVELINKSVKQKSNYKDDNVLIYINKLNDITINNDIVFIKEKVSDDYLLTKNVDIKALLLELMFVLEKDSNEEDNEEAFLVFSENINQLIEIFEPTNYKEVKKQLSVILSGLSVQDLLNNEFFLNSISELKDTIYNIFKEMNIKVPVENNKKDTEQKEEIIENSDENNQKKYDFILSNLKKIKEDKNSIKSIVDSLNSIVSNTEQKNILLILTKTIAILELFISKDITINNDCYMVILQCIYLAQRISLDEKEENLNNLNFLIKRLSVVEDMFNITDIHPTTEIQKKENSQILSSEDYSNLRKNINSFDLEQIRTLRVDTVKLDNLISQTGELLINGIKTREHIVELSKINEKLFKWNSISKKITNYLKYLEKRGIFNSDVEDSGSIFYKRAQSFFNDNAQIINDINNDFTNLYNIISEDDNKLHQTAMEIENIAKGIRVLPLATLFHSFPRMMRDIAKEYNKKIDFIVTGSDTTVDKKIIEEIKMPLIHILRNSVSHGIENPEDRIKNNKNVTGVVRLKATQRENYVIITIEDDGYGVNLEKVKEIALKKGLLTEEEILNLNSEQLMKLLFVPGFSTEESINEISGRGIGLDVVKTKIANLNGDITIDSVLNQGCRVTVRLPLSMSTIKTFILMVNNQKYAIPVNSIKFVKQISKEEIFNKNGIQSVIYDGHSIPIFFLSEVFGEKNLLEKEKQQHTIIIIENQEKQAGYIVDRLLGDQEVFQKKLIAPILKIKNISGFTTLSTGEICLIINPFELIINTVSEKYFQPTNIKQISTNENINY